MSKDNPVAFKDLNEESLKAAAEYFGTEVGPKEVMIADLVENGVDWPEYAGVFLKPVEPVEELKVVEDLTLVGEDNTVTAVVEEVKTAPAVPVLAQANYLIKMERQNPYFEFKKYKFTKDSPYAIMPAEDAQEILSRETGFRQAFPAELEEYYS